MSKFCPECGAMLSENTKFCQGCGAKLEQFDYIPKAKDKEGASEETPPADEKKEEEAPPPADDDKQAEPSCPKCQKAATWVADYTRWYCNDCKEYLPKDTPAPDDAPVVKKEKGLLSELESAVGDVVKTVEDELGDKVICPKCNKKASFIKEYDRWYCHDCKDYLKTEDVPKEEAPAPEDEKKEGAPAPEEEKKDEPLAISEAPKCTTCSKVATWVKEYNRWYCYDCSEYMAKDIPPPAEGDDKTSEAEKEEKPAEEEKKEEDAPAEAEIPKCTKCQKDSTWVKEYNRWYCYDCSEYMAKDLPPPAEGDDKKEEEPAKEEEPPPAEEDKSSEEKEEAPADEAPPTGEPVCPKCNKGGSWIEDYKRWYCNDCKEYLAKDLPPPDDKAEEPPPAEDEKKDEDPAEGEKKDESGEETPATPDCPKCGKPGSWVEDYKRFYCYACEDYLPKEAVAEAASEPPPNEPAPNPDPPKNNPGNSGEEVWEVSK